MSILNEHESADRLVQTRPHSHMLQPGLIVDLAKRERREGSLSLPSGFYDRKSGVWIQPLRTKGRDLEVLVRIVDRRRTPGPRPADADEALEHHRDGDGHRDTGRSISYRCGYRFPAADRP